MLKWISVPNIHKTSLTTQNRSGKGAGYIESILPTITINSDVKLKQR